MTVVVSDVLREHSPEVNFAEDQQVIEAFASRASDPALGVAVGLRPLDRGEHDLDLLGRKHIVEGSGELCVSISNQEPNHIVSGSRIQIRSCCPRVILVNESCRGQEFRFGHAARA